MNNRESTSVVTDSTVIFLHIPKNGGTTAWALLERMFGVGQVKRLKEHNNIRERTKIIGAMMDNNQIDHLRVFGAHFLFMPSHSERYRHFTLLRDPISRTASKYHFTRKQSTYPMHKLFNSIPLEEAIPHMRNNEQIRFIIGDLDRELTHDDLELAKHHLEHKLAAFGLLERYNESLILFKRAFGWPMPYYIIQNESGNRKKSISDEARRIAAEHNALDMALYAWAQTLFEQRIAAQPPEYQRDLERFERTLPLWKRWRTMRRQIIDRLCRFSKQGRGKIQKVDGR